MIHEMWLTSDMMNKHEKYLNYNLTTFFQRERIYLLNLLNNCTQNTFTVYIYINVVRLIHKEYSSNKQIFN